MKLIFTNGAEITVSDISTITGLNIEAPSVAALGAMLANFTEENMKTVTLGENVYHIVIPQNWTVTESSFDAETVNAYVACRFKTEQETISEEIEELQEAVAELSEG